MGNSNFTIILFNQYPHNRDYPSDYRVITYKLNTLLTRFFIEIVDRFLKMISSIRVVFDKEDCEINLRH